MRLQNTADAIQQCALARTVVAQNSRHRTRRHIKADVRPELSFAEGKTQIADLKQSIGVAVHLTHPSALKIM